MVRAAGRIRTASQPCWQYACPRARLSGSAYARSLDGPSHRGRSEHFGHTVNRTRRREVGRPGPTATRTVRGNRLPWAADAGQLCPGKYMRQPVRVSPAAGGTGHLPSALLLGQLHGVYARAAAAVDQYLLPLAAGSQMTTWRGLLGQSREIGAVDCGCYARETGVPGGYRAALDAGVRSVSGVSRRDGLGTFAPACCAYDRI
jgi:hypothetical protein